MTKTLFLPLLLTVASLAAAGLGAAQAAPATDASLEVRFEGISTPTGRIMLTLFDNEAAHDGGGDAVRAAAVDVTGTGAVARFSELAPGHYAVKAFHDIDGDGKMGVNPFGLPTEPFAFSNNAQPENGPPRWAAARFVVQPGVNSISINIK